ncbi:MAG: hypothetical protein G3M70_16290 [Candidatus Nitronauta litoralis]|uniref:Uncharacterized protein n=1 Tax=Candidatus Nitronauta litoralis TaxID=2705533 RepID=A0A7T0BZF5_9BACT|nr:MAG: hypothetical protein G3M70_16290 [Candidatus Nitronauta litoralis]
MSELFTLSDRIEFLPVVHGSGQFMRVVRQRLLGKTYDCLAVCLPPEFQSTVETGITHLPYITASFQSEEDGTQNYVPIDPTQPVIAGLRIALQENIRREFIDLPVSRFEPRKSIFPDTLALSQLTLEEFAVTLLPSLKKPPADSQQDLRIRWMAHQLHRLELECENLIFICSMLDWPWIKAAYDSLEKFPQPEKTNNPDLFGIEHSTLTFALSELPYVTSLYEKRREELRSDKTAEIDGVKEILLRAREKFLERHKVKYHNLSSQAFQVYLQYVRNLSLMESRLTPDLYTLAMAAKQVGGDSFAIALVEAAREYPYQEKEEYFDTMTLGIDQGTFGDDTPVNLKNRLQETELVWRTLDLKPQPDWKKQDEWKYTWDPHGQCSWPPEDDKIESFNTHVREQTKLLLANDLARSEKFTSSVKDGIDIRDTLRNWHTGDIYVKEIPPSRGKVEIVLFLFEMEPVPERYPWRQTWYAEHNEESTLCFFATNYIDNMIGPGIGQATYGGCMMMFPPRPIPNIWDDPRMKLSETLEERLLEAAFFHSQERHVTVVSPAPPPAAWRKLARHYHRRIIHIPLKRFSNQTIEKVRQFHVLNGKQVRSFAQRFISDF